MKILEVDRSLAPGAPSIIGAATPHVTLLTDSSAILPGKPLFIPEFDTQWKLVVCPAIRISRLGKFISPKFARRYYDAISAVARLIPLSGNITGACAQAFDSAIVLGNWLALTPDTPVPPVTITHLSEMQVTIDQQTMQIDRTISDLSKFFTLKTGDIIIPGQTDITDTPAIGRDMIVDIATPLSSAITALNFRIR